jgi:hypothetical protein
MDEHADGSLGRKEMGDLLHDAGEVRLVAAVPRFVARR